MYIVKHDGVIQERGYDLLKGVHEALGKGVVEIAPSVLYFIRMYKECKDDGTSKNKNDFIKDWRDLITLYFHGELIDTIPLNLTAERSETNKLPSIIMEKLELAEKTGKLNAIEKDDNLTWADAEAIVVKQPHKVLRDEHIVLGFTNPYILLSPCEDFRENLKGVSVPALDFDLCFLIGEWLYDLIHTLENSVFYKMIRDFNTYLIEVSGYSRKDFESHIDKIKKGERNK